MSIYAKINPYSVKAIPDGALNDNVMLAVAGEAITAGKVLQLKSDGKVYIADITNLEGKVIGIALKNASIDSTLYVKISGVLRGVITGLTQGEFYYLDTSGNIIANPSGSRVLIGKALSDDELLLMLDITSNAVFGKSVFVKTALTGGTPDALDSIDGALLQDGDIAFVTQQDSFSVYVLDADSGLVEDSPKIIAPDTNAGDKRWILKSLVGGSGDSVFYGKVGIGTTNPQAKLDVKSSTGIILRSLKAIDSGKYIGFYSSDGSMLSKFGRGYDDQTWTGIITLVGWSFAVNDSGNVLIGTVSGSNILTVVQGSATDPIADAWTTYSSIRWKTDLQEIEDALDKVKQLTGRYFTWTIGDKKGKRDIGFIAEEVGAVEPLLVEWDSEKDENGNPYAHALKYERITALLVNAVKELAQKVEQLESKIQ